MLTVHEDLLTRWTSAAERIGGQAGVRIEGERLLALYEKPGRHYHGVDHLRAVLDWVDLLDRFAHDADTVRIAAWFHDAVYDPDRTGNETASALLAETVLDRMDVADEVVEQVSRLVRLTATHAPEPHDRDGHVLCDADLAVLGGTQDEYIAYASAVRLEYAHVPDSTFARGRSEVLQTLLDRPRIYRTPIGRDRWEERARQNLTRELAFLAATVPSELIERGTLHPDDEIDVTEPPKAAGRRRKGA